MTQTRPGAPTWVDLMTTDVTASISFYTELFGWTVDEPTPGTQHYNFRLDGGRVAGVMLVEDELPTSDAWTVDLATPDTAATVTAAAAAGGTILYGPEIVGDLGTMAGFIDPSGAFVGAWQHDQMTGFERTDGPGTACWFELHTKDFAAAVPFYEQAFSWTISMVGDSDQFRMATHGDGDDMVAGIYDAAANDLTTESMWMVYFAVADADATAARIRDLGGALLDELVDTPFGRMAHAVDPQGALFTFLQQSDD